MMKNQENQEKKVPPLIIACFEGDYDTIKFLLNNSADPKEEDTKHDLTAIHVLVDGPYKGQTITETERAQLIRDMIKKGTDVNISHHIRSKEE